jgi:hypothetical protein
VPIDLRSCRAKAKPALIGCLLPKGASHANAQVPLWSFASQLLDAAQPLSRLSSHLLSHDRSAACHARDNPSSTCPSSINAAMSQ